MGWLVKSPEVPADKLNDEDDSFKGWTSLIQRLNYVVSGIVTVMFFVVVVVGLVSCGGQPGISSPRAYGSSTATVQEQQDSNREADSTTSDSMAVSQEYDPDAVPATQAADNSSSGLGNLSVDEDTKNALRNHLATKSALRQFVAATDIADSASAVDDQIWRLLDLADEYHAMGVIANREASWEEAQYYFEKGLSILAALDIEADSLPTPEATKYTIILDNTVADYRVTLRSLGHLESDISTSAVLEQFGNIATRLQRDSMIVFSQEQKSITYDLPIVMNDRVKSAIVYFQTVARDAFAKYLTRSQKYKPLMIATLRKYGLPEDLVYLSLVESGYNPNAYSWARAMGLWQFISSTGRLYGLHRSWWIDERKDPAKSTDAACRFLKDLYEQFGSWELAMAAYNGGPGRIRRTIKKQKTIDFWKMRLKRQTMDYVPFIMAATIMVKNPEKYGFSDIEFEPEVVWEVVPIDRCLELKVVAREIGCSLKELQRLNPELLRKFTPPNTKNYLLKIPKGKKQKFLASYDSMPSPKETSWVKHKIRRGETVSYIAAKYGVSQYAIMEANDLSRRSRIYAGKLLIVPVPLDRDYRKSSFGRNSRDYKANKSIYTVRSGDTMWDIARAFGTSVDKLRRSNYIERGSRIYVGQKLKIPTGATKLKRPIPHKTSSPKTYASKESAPKPTTASSAKGKSKSAHKVRKGDTLWEIARQYGMTTAQLRRLNGLGRSSRIYPGQSLRISSNGGPEYVVHKVRRGETLSRIARRYRTTIAKIMVWNNLSDPDALSVGRKLKIYQI